MIETGHVHFKHLGAPRSDTPRCEGDKEFQVDVGECHTHYGGEGKDADLG